MARLSPKSLHRSDRLGPAGGHSSRWCRQQSLGDGPIYYIMRRTSGIALLLWQWSRQPLSAAFRVVGNHRSQPHTTIMAMTASRSREIESCGTSIANIDVRCPTRRDALSMFTSVSAPIALGGIPLPSHAAKGAGQCVTLPNLPNLTQY